MAESKPQWPGAGDLVIATIEAVTARAGRATVATQGGQGSFRREN